MSNHPHETPEYDQLENAVNSYVAAVHGQGFRAKDFIVSIDMIDLTNNDNVSTTTYCISPKCSLPTAFGLLEVAKHQMKGEIFEN